MREESEETAARGRLMVCDAFDEVLADVKRMRMRLDAVTPALYMENRLATVMASSLRVRGVISSFLARPVTIPALRNSQNRRASHKSTTI